MGHGVCVPLAALIMFICKKVLGFEEMEEVKASVAAEEPVKSDDKADKQQNK